MDDLIQGAAALGYTLSSNQAGSFEKYRDLLLAWNQRFNLTAIRGAEGIERWHFLGSLMCLAVTGDLSDTSMIDVGAGAGFPGLPLKILFPSLRLTLLESSQKKAGFLREVVAQLDLPGTRVVAGRAETVAHSSEHRERYGWAVARGVAELRTLVEYLLPFCPVGGMALAQKGRGAEQEIEAARPAIKRLGGGQPVLHNVKELAAYDLPAAIVVVEKVSATPAGFPRRPGMPTKRPL